ncbi:MAG: diaminopimelate epimerase [Gammaproteobacteria bacterium]|nr:MAG: diaminopimelate epimerase [Gammaproteobacteria bacterium]
MLSIKFKKYHALGNNFLMMDEMGLNSADYFELAKSICCDYSGFGTDGLIIIGAKDKKILHVNKDGTLAALCGNGLRCSVHYFWEEHKILNNTDFIKTDDGLKKVCILGTSPFTSKVKIRDKKLDIKKIIYENKNLNQAHKNIYFLHVGVPHAVVFVKDLNDFDAKIIGKEIHDLKEFHNFANVNFVQIQDENNLKVITYERGVNDTTLACGTGGTASVVVANSLGICSSKVSVHFPIGDLNVENLEGETYISGASYKIGEGTYYWKK